MTRRILGRQLLLGAAIVAAAALLACDLRGVTRRLPRQSKIPMKNILLHHPSSTKTCR
jgi:hypothetical protein